MQKTILVVGDLHYGKEQTDVLKPFACLLDLAKKIDAQLFINGDLFNYWYETRNKVPEGCDPMLEHLKAATASGLDIFVLRGNRDFLMNDMFEKMAGAKLLREEVLVLEDYKIMITHGDQYDKSWKYRLFRKCIRSKFVYFLIHHVPMFCLLKVIVFLQKKSAGKKNIKYDLPSDIHCPDQYRMVLGHYHQKAIQQHEGYNLLFCPAFDQEPQVLKLTMDSFEFMKVI